MGRASTALLFVASALWMAGCATSPAGRLAAAEGQPVYKVWTGPTGQYTFVTERCPHKTYRTGPCEEVAGTRNPADEEFWKYKQYIPVRFAMYGAVPLSPWYKDENKYAIVGAPGDRAMCEARRVQIKKPRGVAGDDGEIWADPCYGPFYFRRVPPEAASARK